MCGIAGLWMKDPASAPSREWLDRMSDVLAHRGPDGRGAFVDGALGLVHTRLAIIDLESGQQPMSTSDGQFTITYNGEIYNYREERERLTARGHRFRTRSDTEVILELFRERGEEFPQRLRGMFALALWDHARQRLYLARDRFGIKPLFLFENAHCLAFASEAKALLALPFVPREVDPLAIKEYLTLQHTLGSRSVFRGIRRLEPARLLRVSREGSSEREYWSLSYADQGNGIPGSAREAVRAALTESVTGHLVSDVPVGALLSGGLDTSAIVAVASPAYPGTLHTYTACSEPEPSNSDRFYAN
jgi:asparagine synthase (glutamine-hydrolysing)